MKFQEKCEFPLGEYKVTFDDVTLRIPEAGSIKSRRNVDLSVSVKDLKLNLPVVGANMSTVMGEESARYLALMGGIGIIHQNFSIHQQYEEVRKVKRFSTPLVYNPFFLLGKSTVREVLDIFESNSIGAVIVVDDFENRTVRGIITKRDLMARSSEEDRVEDLMTGFDKLNYINSEDCEIDFEQSRKLLKEARVEQLPILNRENKLMGLFTRKGYQFYKDFNNAARDKYRRLVVGAAVGQNRSPLERIEALVRGGVDLIVLDTAHGRTEGFLELIRKVRNNFPDILLAAGNIDSPLGALDFAEAGADIIKVGVGPGGACKTRVQTGFGTPQLSAVGEIKEALEENGFSEVKMIGDGGINKAGNLAKALAAGADFGMVGSMLAGTDLAPGDVRSINGKLYKDFRGMASYQEAEIANTLSGRKDGDPYGPVFEEGGNDIIPFKGEGSFIDTIRLLHGGLASSLSYCNAHNLEEFYQKSRFQLQSLNGVYEGKPRIFT